MRSLRAAWLLFGALGCTPQGDPALSSAGFEDTFDGVKLGDAWRDTGGGFRLSSGKLHVHGARNRPLWLARRLSHDVRVEFDATSDSPDGDIKVELFGDGRSKAETTSYTATGYVVIFGGWNNSLNVLARLTEHGKDRVVGPTYKVIPHHTYRMKIERLGATLTAWADGRQLARMVDANPLYGRQHDHFAFNNWQSDLTFDNLVITPL